MRKHFYGVLQAVLPITVLVLLIQFTFLSLPLATIARFLGGALMVMAGLLFFLYGVKISLLPIGQAIGAKLPQRVSFALLLVLCLVLGLLITMAEPDVRVLAHQVDYVSGGEIGKGILIFAVACGVGISVSLAILRIFLNIRIAYVLAAGYGIVFLLSIFVPSPFIPVAFDAGGVTTGPITVAFILALGVGVVSVLGGKTAIADGFGIVGIASIGPIISVMILGMLQR